MARNLPALQKVLRIKIIFWVEGFPFIAMNSKEFIPLNAGFSFILEIQCKEEYIQFPQ
jgi:hypothetical protein